MSALLPAPSEGTYPTGTTSSTHQGVSTCSSSSLGLTSVSGSSPSCPSPAPRSLTLLHQREHQEEEQEGSSEVRRSGTLPVSSPSSATSYRGRPAQGPTRKSPLKATALYALKFQIPRKGDIYIRPRTPTLATRSSCSKPPCHSYQLRPGDELDRATPFICHSWPRNRA